MDRNKGRRVSKMKRIILMVLISLIILILFSNAVWDSGRYIVWTKYSLRSNRFKIEKFKEIKNKYPYSLTELKAKINDELDGKIYKEYISSKKGQLAEAERLDGEGGWYYNPATGELKINLLEPVKKYYPFYFGECRNEIPSNW
ncbi:MAG: hypothetical protein KKH34_07285 [Candidatus Omnitrophica bacterium]|nr:hypothetical protein [Candidatus Omnitrophota bacterium]